MTRHSNELILPQSSEDFLKHQESVVSGDVSCIVQSRSHVNTLNFGGKRFFRDLGTACVKFRLPVDCNVV